MADIKKLSPIILRWEGGFSNDPKDHGGETNMGVTIATWKSQGYDIDKDGDIDVQDLKLMKVSDFEIILRKYWDKWKADQIKNQSVANILVDWVWGSGKWGIVIPQRILKVYPDGLVGQQTLAALSVVNQRGFFDAIKFERATFLHNIVKNDPSQERFINGWLNRLNSFKYSD